jgi:hypothetical protein
LHLWYLPCSIEKTHWQVFREITFRYNTRKFTQDVRFSTVITRCNGRLKYDDLIQGYGPNLDESLQMQEQRALQTKYIAAELISILKHGNVSHALEI